MTTEAEAQIDRLNQEIQRLNHLLERTRRIKKIAKTLGRRTIITGRAFGMLLERQQCDKNEILGLTQALRESEALNDAYAAIQARAS